MLSGNYQPREATVSDISAYVMNGGARWTTGPGTRKAVTAAAAAGVDEEYGDDFPALILQVGKRRHRRRRRGRGRRRRMDNSLPLACFLGRMDGCDDAGRMRPNEWQRAGGDRARERASPAAPRTIMPSTSCVGRPFFAASVWEYRRLTR